jgi:hypothetical protein
MMARKSKPHEDMGAVTIELPCRAPLGRVSAIVYQASGAMSGLVDAS